MIYKNINEQHGDLTILTPSTRNPNGYMAYYWCLCKCGNIKRYRYDQARKKGNCGLCEDFMKSNVLRALKERESGKE